MAVTDAELGQVYGQDGGPAGLARCYAAQADWDPRESGERMRFLMPRPMRVQARREVNELQGRALIRGGT